MNERLDIILFGATGVTGKYCIYALYHLTTITGRERLTWGVAGRSEKKLEETLAHCQRKLGNNVDLKDIPVIIANVDNYDSLKYMTGSAKIIINCCGPYQFYGEPVVKACIETGTHQVDVSGETQYMETMELKYHELAKEKGVYIINSCGVDSIVNDLGVIFLERNFEGTLNSVETFYQSDIDRTTSSNSIINFGTWESAVHGIGSAHQLKDIRSKLYKNRLPKFLPKLQTRNKDDKCEIIDDEYAVAIPGCDRSVVARSRRYLYENRDKRPIQLEYYYRIKTPRGLFLLKMYAGIFLFLAQWKFGRKLLLKFPEFFSNGYFARAENLSEEQLDNSKFALKYVGKGWEPDAAKLESDSDNFKNLPNKTIIGSLEGNSSSYGFTGTAAVLAAIIVLTESDKLPPRGGVYTPGAAFFDTSLIDQLHTNNVVPISFNIKSKL